MDTEPSTVVIGNIKAPDAENGHTKTVFSSGLVMKYCWSERERERNDKREETA